MYKRVLKLVQGALHVYKRALNDVKMVLYSEQFGHEVTSSRFCVVYNLGLKLHNFGLKLLQTKIV